MTTLDGFYLDPHRTQFDGSRYEGENCTPTTGGNGANAVTSGRISLSGAQVRALVARSEETNPTTPGWSLRDLALAMSRLHLAFEDRTGTGWAALEHAHNSGQYVSVQGDSDQFSNATCSGAFNGAHDIGIHPASKTVSGVLYWWIDDPICKVGRWERPYIIRRYAEKLYPSVRWGMFVAAVPRPSTAILYRVHIDGRTSIYASPNGTKTGSVSLATYTCTRQSVGGAWWYHIVGPKTSANLNHWIPAEPTMTVTRL